MIDFKFTIATLKTALGVLLVGGVWLSSVEAAAEISTPQGAVQNLNGIVARNWERNSDGINEQPVDSGIKSFINLPSQQATEISVSAYSNSYRLTDFQRSNWEVETASQDWLNLNRGDGSQNVVRFVVWRF